VVGVAAPARDAVVYDPACGSGTFLSETLRFWRDGNGAGATSRVYGSDINARMLLIAELNLGHVRDVEFLGRTLDALSPGDSGHSWPRPNSVDLILTNPPFGVYVDPVAVESLGLTTTPRRGTGGKLQSEVLFVEQCLRWLRPGGMLAIVVPRSVVTNDVLTDARRAIDLMASLVAVLALPPETFASTGTQTNTVVLFLRKRGEGASTSGATVVPVAEVSNVGYDSTGRERAGSQLTQAASDLREAMTTGGSGGLVRPVEVPGDAQLSAFAAAWARGPGTRTTRRLGDLVEVVQTGRTPARSAYTPAGVFTVKVGNLTGQGIDWTPRDRNFVAPAAVSDGLMLAEGDVVLTSSAHHPRDIAEKVDIVHAVPSAIGGRATFTAEVMRLRVKRAVADPYELLAILRMPGTKAAIRRLVRGQTAHLRPKDLLDLPVPEGAVPDRAVALLKREAELARELNLVMAEERALFGSLESTEENAFPSA
ncbi:MAG: N-6 DNA methylase, partial [Deltaproteobacteria bacterium]|nr:N-6 DNA methylase [Deltaproteobacteria bacterium]